MKIAILGSGSSGNSIYIEDSGIELLIDAGFSCKKIEERLGRINILPSKIKAILITHEHSDHILGAGVFSRKYNTPIFISPKSYQNCKEKLGLLSDDMVRFVEDDFMIEETIHISPFEVMHDAEMTIGFRATGKSGHTIAIATDIGYATNIVKDKFHDVDVAVIESNYDYEMLITGKYPWELKERVKGNTGHLSNIEAAKFIKNIFSEKLKKVYLAHVSKDNNRYEMAYDSVSEYLRDNQITVDIEVAKQDEVSELYVVYDG